MLLKHSLLSLLIASSVICGTAQAAESPAAAKTFTPEQEARIGQVAADYLVAHPEILVQVSQKLQAQQQEQQMQSLSAAAIANHAALTQDKGTPSFGPQDAKVVVVEFFDYQCIYCSHLAPVMEQVMKANPQVKYVFKEWPIFGSRWENSIKAAQTGLQIWQQKGADAYLSYHNALFATGHNEGKLTADDISKAANAVKFDAKKGVDVTSTLEGINSLAQQVGFGGTPGLVVMPASGASADNTTVIPGMTSKEALQAAIDRASGK